MVLVSVLVALAGAERVDAQTFAVKANAALYAAATPNIGFEIVSGGRTSVDLMLAGHYNPYGIGSRMIDLQGQFKYWIGGRPLVREYIGVIASAFSYDYTRKRKVHEGNAACIGVTAGYVLPLNRRWGVEFSAGVGVYAYHERKFPSGTAAPAYAGPVSLSVLPANLGVTFIYIIR